MILTHHAPHVSPPWMAVDIEAACQLLKNYPLTDKEKTDLPELIAGWGRLVEEAGLCHYGETEAEAVASAAAGGGR